MTLPRRIRERVVNATLTIFLFIATGIYSCTLHAQTLQVARYDGDLTTCQANKNINVSGFSNQDSRARSIPKVVNSAYQELKPIYAPGGKRLFFSRANYPDNTFGLNDREDIWYSDMDTATGDWGDPVRLPGLLNNGGPNYINNVSLTGDTIVLGNQYLHNGKMKAGLSYSVNVNGEWSQPVAIHIKNDYNISTHASAFVAIQTGVIIQAVERLDSKGGRDLYVSFWDGETATEPMQMGTILNSALEESSPCLADDGRTLFFASKGFNGYGGYDIFMSRRLDDTWTNWSEPVNLGPAVNGPLDEEFFSVSHCGRKAIFSKQLSVHNFDIYSILMKDLFTEVVVPVRKDFGPANGRASFR